MKNGLFFKKFFFLMSSCRSFFKYKEAQATLEFLFAMIIAIMLLIGMIRVFIWTGKDLADRRKAHENFLMIDVHGRDQTKPDFYYSSPIGATFDSSLNP